MAWFKVDDKFHAAEEVLTLPREQRLAAIGLWTLAGAWSSDHLKDGFVPASAVELLGATVELADALVRVKLWTKNRRGYQFRNWERWQVTRAVVEQNRAAERDRKEKYRNRLRDTPTTTGESPADVPMGQIRAAQPRPGYPDPTRPDPTRPVAKATSSPRAAELPLPKDWVPTAEHFTTAKELGVDLVKEAEAFRLHAETHDRRAARWNSAFTTWIKKSTPTVKKPPVDWMNP